jgi:hypothetical protein
MKESGSYGHGMYKLQDGHDWNHIMKFRAPSSGPMCLNIFRDPKHKHREEFYICGKGFYI